MGLVPEDRDGIVRGTEAGEPAARKSSEFSCPSPRSAQLHCTCNRNSGTVLWELAGHPTSLPLRVWLPVRSPSFAVQQPVLVSIGLHRASRCCWVLLSCNLLPGSSVEPRKRGRKDSFEKRTQTQEMMDDLSWLFLFPLLGSFLSHKHNPPPLEASSLVLPLLPLCIASSPPFPLTYLRL